MDVDGELSTFEDVLLNAHLADCAECREFRSTVVHAANALRTAPLEHFTVTATGRVRRRVSRALAPAVAALAIISVGLGSLVSSSHLGSGIAHRNTPPATALELVGANYDTVNAQMLKAVQRIPTPDPAGRLARTGGGPYVSER